VRDARASTDRLPVIWPRASAAARVASRILATALLLLAAPCSVVRAQTWSVDAAGPWNTAANWSPATVPNTAGAAANFGNVNTAARTVTLSGTTRTVGSITLDSAAAWTINSGTLVLNSGTAAAGSISVGNTNGNAAHTIGSAISAVAGLALANASTGTLTLGGVVSGTGPLALSGPGTVRLGGANTFVGNLVLSSGTLEVGTDSRFGNAANDVLIDGGRLATIASFTLGAGRVITIGPGGGAIGDNNLSTLTLGTAGQLAGSGTLTHFGTGTLALNAANAGFTGGLASEGGLVQTRNNDALGTGGLQGALTLTGTAGLAVAQAGTGLVIRGAYSDTATTSLRVASPSGNGFAQLSTQGLQFANGLVNDVRATLRGVDLVNSDPNFGASGAGTVVRVFGTVRGDGNNTDTYFTVQQGGRFEVMPGAVIDTLLSGASGRPLRVVGDGDPSSVFELNAGFEAASAVDPNVRLTNLRLSASTLLTHASQNLPASVQFLGIGAVWRTATAAQTQTGGIAVNADGRVDTLTDLTTTGGLTGASQLEKTGSATLRVQGVSTFTGRLVVREGVADLDQALPGAVTVSDGAQLVSGGNVQGGVTFGTGGGTWRVDTVDQTTAAALAVDGDATLELVRNLTLAGGLAGTADVVKRGAGLLTSSAASTHAGQLVVEAGTARFTASAATTDVELRDGGELATSGAGVAVRSVTTRGVGGARWTVDGGAQSLAGAFDVGAATTLSATSDLAIAGPLTGSGALTRTGTGAVRFDGASPWTGALALDGAGTTRFAQRLEATSTTLGAGATLVTAAGVTGPVAIGAGGGTWRVESAAQTLSGTLALGGPLTLDVDTELVASTTSGAATLTRNGAGRLAIGALGGALDARGGTTEIDGGIGGALALDNGATVRTTGSVGGPFSTGAGGGTLVVDAGSATLGGPVTVGGATVVDTTAALDTAGPVSGGGALEKRGAGTWRVGDASGLTGAVRIVAGELRVDGGLGSAPVTVDTGAAFAMTGASIGPLTSDGDVDLSTGPGFAPRATGRPVAVGGDLALGAASTLRLLAAADGSIDRVDVAGNAIVDGTLDLRNSAGRYARNTRYVLVDATGSVTGQFATVRNQFVFLAATVTYEASHVLLDLQRNTTDFGPAALGANRAAAASALGGLETSGAIDPTLQANLGGADLAALGAALASLSGEVHAAATVAGQRLAQRQSDDVLQQLACGATGVATGDARAAGGVRLSVPTLSGRAGADRDSGGARWRGGGLALGAGHTDCERAGVYGQIGVDNLTTTRDGDTDRVDATTAHAALGARAPLGPWRLRGVVALGAGDARTQRVATDTVQRHALATSHGVASTSIATEVALPLAFAGWRLEPLVGVQWTQVRSGAFVEAGEASVALRSGADRHDRTVARIGTRALLAADLSDGFVATSTSGLALGFGAFVEHDATDVPQRDLAFVADPTTGAFTVTSPGTGRTALALDSALRWAPTPLLSVELAALLRVRDNSEDWGARAALVQWW
jgi:autotransporter-associated beta strand protein